MKVRNRHTGEVFEVKSFFRGYTRMVRIKENGEEEHIQCLPGEIEPVGSYDRESFIRETAKECLAGLMANPNSPVAGVSMLVNMAVAAARQLARQLDAELATEDEAARE